jgi:polar amino acid transport system substrate-binding protein
MKLVKWWLVLVLALVSACASIPDVRTAAARKELAPTGTLRVGVVIAPVAANPFFATKDPATGKRRGVTIDLGAELAQKLGVPLELVAYAPTAALLKDTTSGAWDVTFLPIDPEREKVVDFGPAYFVTESTYLVPPGSTIRSIAEVDRPGVRVAARIKSTQAAHLSKSLKNATLLLPGTVAAVLESRRDRIGTTCAHKPCP